MYVVADGGGGIVRFEIAGTDTCVDSAGAREVLLLLSGR